MHTLYKALGKSLHRSRGDRTEVTQLFHLLDSLNLMNTLHTDTEYFPVIFVNVIKKN